MKRSILAFILTAAGIVPAVIFTMAGEARGEKISEVFLDLELRKYEATSSVASSTHTPTELTTTPLVDTYLLGASIGAYGGDVDFTLHYTTKSYSPTAPFVVRSTYQYSSGMITVRDGDVHNFGGQTILKDPKIVIHGLNTAATVQVNLEYGIPYKN